MKRGVTYLSPAAYRRYKLKRNLTPIILKMIKVLTYFIMLTCLMWSSTHLVMRALDIEYKMQLAVVEKHFIEIGEENDIKK